MEKNIKQDIPKKNNLDNIIDNIEKIKIENKIEEECTPISDQTFIYHFKKFFLIIFNFFFNIILSSFYFIKNKFSVKNLNELERCKRKNNYYLFFIIFLIITFVYITYQLTSTFFKKIEDEKKKKK